MSRVLQCPPNTNRLTDTRGRHKQTHRYPWTKVLCQLIVQAAQPTTSQAATATASGTAAVMQGHQHLPGWSLGWVRVCLGRKGATLVQERRRTTSQTGGQARGLRSERQPGRSAAAPQTMQPGQDHTMNLWLHAGRLSGPLHGRFRKAPCTAHSSFTFNSWSSCPWISALPRRPILHTPPFQPSKHPHPRPTGAAGSRSIKQQLLFPLLTRCCGGGWCCLRVSVCRLTPHFMHHRLVLLHPCPAEPISPLGSHQQTQDGRRKEGRG